MTAGSGLRRLPRQPSHQGPRFSTAAGNRDSLTWSSSPCKPAVSAPSARPLLPTGSHHCAPAWHRTPCLAASRV